MNEFQKAEELGRICLTRYKHIIGFSNLNYSEDEFSVYDATSDQGLIEVKYRDIKYSKLKDIIMEETKYRNLRQLSKQLNTPAYYVMFFLDGIVAVVDVNLINLNKVNREDKLCNKTTAVYSNKVVKPMLMLKDYDEGVSIFKYR